MLQVPAAAADEAGRLEALRSLGVLDTEPEERFDRLTRTARRLFDVPIALVSLVDANRQWFKSCMGLGVRETTRDISFCGHTILGDDVFVITDAWQDPRFADNPLVTGEPHIRFYAGCPLRVAGGHKLGTLCIIDSRPRSFRPDDVAALKDLAGMVQSELSAVQMATEDALTGILPAWFRNAGPACAGNVSAPAFGGDTGVFRSRQVQAGQRQPRPRRW